jgi:hypothetical protein
MKSLLLLSFLLMPQLRANTWSYQVNINGNPGKINAIDEGKASFEAGSHFCEVTPVTVLNKTEYRTLVCSFGAGTVSTGGLCTQKGVKVPSVQYAILNLNGPKNQVSVTASCLFH